MDISRQNLQVVLRQLCEWGNDLHSIDWDSSCLARDPPTPPTQFEFGLLAHLPIFPLSSKTVFSVHRRICLLSLTTKQKSDQLIIVFPFPSAPDWLMWVSSRETRWQQTSSMLKKKTKKMPLIRPGRRRQTTRNEPNEFLPEKEQTNEQIGFSSSQGPGGYINAHQVWWMT